MAILLCSMKVIPEHVERWEEIARALTRETQGDRGLRRYEYYRGAENYKYYVMLSFDNTDCFYEHQGAEYHDVYFGEAAPYLSDLTFEWLDPLPGGGSELPPTSGSPISDSASDRAKAQVETYPIVVQHWWTALRERDAALPQ